MTMVSRAEHRRAERLFRIRFGLKLHWRLFVIINLGMALINLAGSTTVLWFVYPLVGWGIGLLIHTMAASHALSGGRAAGVQAELEHLHAERDHSRSRPF